MNTRLPMIPYEKQSDDRASRTCGAACLSMAYRSFGKRVPQAEIWPSIAKTNRFGALSSTTHLMCQDALNRGFRAMAVQARHPLQALRLCRDFGVRAILNHRLRSDAGIGHYSILVHIDEQVVLSHDPLLGPSRSLTHAELLALWMPNSAESEIAGNVLIAVADTQMPPIDACQICAVPMPPRVNCPQCQKPVSLEPRSVLGCVRDACIGRMWNYICCPVCDCAWTLGPSPRQPAPAAAGLAIPSWRSLSARGPARPPADIDVSKLFGEVDKFCNHILGIPAAANHPEIKRQLELIAAGKKKFKQAYAEALAQRTALQTQSAALIKATEEQRDSRRKKLEALDTPAPPLDGNGLARALLRNVGLAWTQDFSAPEGPRGPS